MKKLSLLLSITLMLFSCGSDDDNGEGGGTTSYTSISPSEINVTKGEGRIFSISIDTEKEWVISNSSDWCHFDETQGAGKSSIDLYIKPNKETSNRSTKIEINDKTLYVKQEGSSIVKDGDIIGFIDNKSTLEAKATWADTHTRRCTYKINPNAKKEIVYHADGTSYYLEVKDMCIYDEGDEPTYFGETNSVKFIYDLSNSNLTKEKLRGDMASPKKIELAFLSFDESFAGSSIPYYEKTCLLKSKKYYGASIIGDIDLKMVFY